MKNDVEFIRLSLHMLTDYRYSYTWYDIVVIDSEGDQGNNYVKNNII